MDITLEAYVSKEQLSTDIAMYIMDETQSIMLVEICQGHIVFDIHRSSQQVPPVEITKLRAFAENRI